jgi:hypothetical protein
MTMGDGLLSGNATDFFRERLREAFEQQRVQSSEEVEFYLVNLLERFLRVEGEIFARPLALAYLESQHDEPAQRYAKLKSVGDTALFLTGVFTESLETSPVGIGYYMSLGGMAYRGVADLAANRIAREAARVFDEMALRFPDFVRVLAEMDLQESLPTSQETLKIYRRWLATRSARDAERLIRRGIIPFAPRRNDWSQ